MFPSAIAALRQIFTPPFRRVLYKVLGLTLALLVLAWLGLSRLIDHYLNAPWPWVETAIQFFTGIGLFVGLAFLVAPVSMLVAGIFLDEMAEQAEVATDPAGPSGKALPAGIAIGQATRFALVSLAVNLLALVLLLVPGVNVIAFFGANAYLFSREYFEFAAMRYRTVDEARALRRRNGFFVFLCGLPIAAFLAVPVLNLLTPLFATAYMVRVYKRMALKPNS